MGIQINREMNFEFTSKTSDYTVGSSDCDGTKTFGNDGAGGEVNWSLPAGSSGYAIHFYVVDAQYLKVTANGTEKIRFEATQSAAGGYIRSNTVGNSVTLKWSGDDWVITSIEGEWNYDE